MWRVNFDTIDCNFLHYYLVIKSFQENTKQFWAK